MIGENIKKIREEKHLGLNETARMAGISGSYLSNIEKNIKLNPSMESLEKIAKALNVSVEDFFKEKKFRMPKLLQRKLLYEYTSFNHSIDELNELTGLSEEEITDALTHVPISNYENLLLVGKFLHWPKESIDAYLKEDEETLSKYENLDQINQWLKNYFDEYNNPKPNKVDDLGFESPEEAIQFILKQPIIMGYGGFNVDKMNNEEIIEFANELLNQLKLLGYKYKK